LPIFNLNGENETGTERYMNRMEKNQTRTERYVNGTARGKFSISATAVTVTLLALAFLGDETAIRISI
jgi:hypothetical protein